MTDILCWFSVSVLAFELVLSVPLGPQNYIVENAHIVAYESDCTPSMFKARPGKCNNVHHHCTSIMSTRVLLEFSCHEDCCFDAEIVNCVCDHERGANGNKSPPNGRGGRENLLKGDSVLFADIADSYPRKTGEPSTDKPYLKDATMNDLRSSQNQQNEKGGKNYGIDGKTISFVDIMRTYPRKNGEPSTDRPAYLKGSILNDLRIPQLDDYSGGSGVSGNTYRDEPNKGGRTIPFPDIMHTYPKKTGEPSTDRPIVKGMSVANEQTQGSGNGVYMDFREDDSTANGYAPFEMFKIYKNSDKLSNSAGKVLKGVGATDKPWWVGGSQPSGRRIQQDISVDSYSDESEDNIRKKRRGSPPTDAHENFDTPILAETTESSQTMADEETEESDVSTTEEIVPSTGDDGPTEGAQSVEETTPNSVTKKPKKIKHKKDKQKSVVKARKSNSTKQEAKLSISLG